MKSEFLRISQTGSLSSSWSRFIEWVRFYFIVLENMFPWVYHMLKAEMKKSKKKNWKGYKARGSDFKII